MRNLKLVEKPSLYDTDFYAWSYEQAALLKQRKHTNLDYDNLIEEIQTLGRSDYDALESAYLLVLMHLLKWQFQPQYQGASWQKTLRAQRRAILKKERKSPSLKAKYAEIIEEAYRDAIEEASDETGLPLSIFPATCPYTAEQIRDLEFYPS